MPKCKNQNVWFILIKVNMLTREHLVYQKTMTSWLTFNCWCTLKLILSSSLSVVVGFWIIQIWLSNVEVMVQKKGRGLSLNINPYRILTTDNMCTFTHVNGPQFYSIWFAQRTPLLSYIYGPKGRHSIFT
jgi:hypothetical protein